MREEPTRYPFPFAAIVGQEEMKRALLLNIVDPGIGGVLIRGEKGTAKSTAVRALAGVLGPRLEIEGCRFNCDPQDPASWCEACRSRESHVQTRGRMRVVELPINATEDRVVGTLDIEAALKGGVKRFEPGILAEANRNILYIDEVNLLDDHIVDLLLDAAAMGVNIVEREGLSYSHPSRFALVGTMNPEEGDLRPQLIDRFGLVVDIESEKDVSRRAEVVRRRLDYERSPADYAKKWNGRQTELRKQIENARSLLPKVGWSQSCVNLAAEIAVSLEVDGHRADITLMKTAVANAALEGRARVEGQDMVRAARLALPHRLHRRPFQEGFLDMDEVQQLVGSYGRL